MKTNHLLSETWESYSENISRLDYDIDTKSISEILKNIFSVGPMYHYILRLHDSGIEHISNSILEIHDLQEFPKNIHEIIELIHPDDLDYVLRAEKTTLEIINNIGFEHHLNLKSSYNFRMKVAHGDYHLFHHQAIHLTKDLNGGLTSAANIHTDISHITNVNSYIVLIQGIGPRNDNIQVDLSNTMNINKIPKFTTREKEILKLVCNGYSSQEIAEKLFISVETVRVHRKNIHKKTNTHKLSQIIKNSLEWGLI